MHNLRVHCVPVCDSHFSLNDLLLTYCVCVCIGTFSRTANVSGSFVNDLSLDTNVSETGSNIVASSGSGTIAGCAVWQLLRITYGQSNIQTRLFDDRYNVTVRHTSDIDPIDCHDSIAHFQLVATIRWAAGY